jgi:hypothetical protein
MWVVKLNKVRKVSPNFTELSLHWGLKNHTRYMESFATQYYFQFGIGYDYLQNNSAMPYGIIQIGIETRFAHGRIN